jgi:catechol 2,3-dioxygenase-like lactoylglutathione lyase family enzyme
VIDMQNAQPPFDRSTEDIGNLVEFGHVNVRVPDQRLAILFYVTGLGLTRDPYLVTGVDNAWINVGRSQFHLPVGPAQVLRGVTGLVMPDLDALVVRLQGVKPRLSDTMFAFERAGAHVDVMSPWGNRLRVHAPDVARFGRMLLGMPYVQVDVVPGTVKRIARFYSEVFAVRTGDVIKDGSSASVRIPVGLNESLVFRETSTKLAPYDGHHIQVAVADFSGVHRRLLDRGLISEESNQSQYRFENIVDIDNGEVLATIEHEVRSMRHPMFARALVNRNPTNTTDNYATGHEAAAWRMPPD